MQRHYSIQVWADHLAERISENKIGLGYYGILVYFVKIVLLIDSFSFELYPYLEFFRIECTQKLPRLPHMLGLEYYGILVNSVQLVLLFAGFK